MTDLQEKLQEISQNIKEQWQWIKLEETTKQVAILPFIRALGYDTADAREVALEQVADPRSSGGEAVDYAIMRAGEPILLIEAKAARVTLGENQWRQLHSYFGATDVHFGLLTNGIDYRFYTDLQKKNIMDKEPFLAFNIHNIDATTVAQLQNFCKGNFDSERILTAARKAKLERHLREELKSPSQAFARHFAARGSSGPLSAAQLQQTAQLLQEIGRDLLAPKIARPAPRPIPEAPPSAEAAPSATPLPSTEAAPEKAEASAPEKVEVPAAEGSLPKNYPRGAIEIPVWGEYKGHRFEAKLLLSKTLSIYDYINIRFEGKYMNHTDAMRQARRSVHPDAPYVAAWTFWKFKHPDSQKEVPIRDIFDINSGRVDWQKSSILRR